MIFEKARRRKLKLRWVLCRLRWWNRLLRVLESPRFATAATCVIVGVWFAGTLIWAARSEGAKPDPWQLRPSPAALGVSRAS